MSSSLCWERATPWRIFVDHTAYERHWSGALPAMSLSLGFLRA